MRFAYLVLIVVVALVVPFSKALTCFQNSDRCGEEQCCKQFEASENIPFGSCKALRGENERCEFNPIKSRKAKHVYMNMCPCAEGFECVKDGDSELTGVCSTKAK